MPLASRSCSCVLVAVALNLLFSRISSKPMNVWVTMPFTSWQSPQALREGRVCGNGVPLFTISGLPSTVCLMVIITFSSLLGSPSMSFTISVASVFSGFHL